jgi:gamma-glutamyltranspeptidase/glutathione hydrolase
MAAATSAHDRPAGPRHKTRSSVLARNGMAATSQPLATATAIRVLQEGGNAIDAAIAANAVIGVTEPMSCGIGGDLFAIVWDAKSGKLHGLNASGRAPLKATIELFRQRGDKQIPIEGPLSWSVPGCVDGWAALHSRFGTRPWAELLAPAIAYAEAGFPVSEIIAADWLGSADTLRAIPTSAVCFLIDGQAPRTGEVFKNPGLARSLRAIAERGRDAFYKGPITQTIVQYSDHAGGLFTLDDFSRHTSTWIDPVSTNYRGYDVWELPPNGQGIAALQMLNLLEAYDVEALGFGNPELLHLMVEAKKLAFEDRARYYADIEFAQVPVDALISKEYAARRRPAIDARHASTSPQPGDLASRADTIYMTVVDKDFNAVSLIQSNFFSFGSKHVPGDLGFVLQNRGCLFALDETHPNRLEPGKRPFHTIIPGFVTRDGKPWLSFGVMGGDMQPQGHVQVLINMIDFGMDPQEAGDAPRWRHDGSSEPTGTPAKGVGTLYLESGFGPEVEAALRGKGHAIEAGNRGGYGGYQAIRIDTERGVLIGGSDPRKDGAAAGY